MSIKEQLIWAFCCAALPTAIWLLMKSDVVRKYIVGFQIKGCRKDLVRRCIVWIGVVITLLCFLISSVDGWSYSLPLHDISLMVMMSVLVSYELMIRETN